MFFCITFSVLAAYLRRKSKLRYVSQPTRWQRMERWGPTLKNSMENCRMPPGPPAVLCLRKSFYGQEIGPWPGGGIYIYIYLFFSLFFQSFLYIISRTRMGCQEDKRRCAIWGYVDIRWHVFMSWNNFIRTIFDRADGAEKKTLSWCNPQLIDIVAIVNILICFSSYEISFLDVDIHLLVFGYCWGLLRGPESSEEGCWKSPGRVLNHLLNHVPPRL